MKEIQSMIYLLDDDDESAHSIVGEWLHIRNIDTGCDDPEK